MPTLATLYTLLAIQETSAFLRRQYTRIVLLLAVLAVAGAALSACADVGRMSPNLKRMLDDKDRWSHGGP